MSAKSEHAEQQLSEEAGDICACCGIAPVDDIQLEGCNGGCDLVKYCSDKCLENHREQHEGDCKQRKAELRDKELFEQPDGTHLGECPICFLPIPIDTKKSREALRVTTSVFHSCCCETICRGCAYADDKNPGVNKCPFCREPAVGSSAEIRSVNWNDAKEENKKRVMKRVKANDPNALCYMAATRWQEGDYDGSIEYYTKAAELGDSKSHFHLGLMYEKGEVVKKNKEKEIYHYEIAAIGGHPGARWALAYHELENGSVERSVKHSIIGAKLGYDASMKMLWEHYAQGAITKEELEATLRAHKAAIDETKSAQREEAYAYYQRKAMYDH